MAEVRWNPWKMTAIGMALVIVTALVTGLVVANWTGPEPERKAAAVSAPARPARAADARAADARPVSTAPSQSAIDSCNQHAASVAPARDKTAEVVKDAVIGGAVGAAVGAGGGAVVDGGKGAGKGAAIGGIVGAGGGALYGLNENRRQDEKYREAYASCMRSRGYTS